MQTIESRPYVKEVRTEKERHLTYNPDFDSQKYEALNALKDTLPEEYAAKKAMLDGETVFNLKTMLGERYNAGISSREDRVMGGKIYSTFSDEPLETVFARGRDYRYENSSDHDRMREQAELDGFSKIQEVLGIETTPVGTRMISLSPPGGEDSEYKHNFYDIFTLREKNDERVIEVSRYSSALERHEYIDFAASVSPGYFAEHEYTDLPFDAYFLSKPIMIDPDQTGLTSADDIHNVLHKEHTTLSREDYEYILKGCEPLFLAYINVLATRPWAITERNTLLNTIMNKADHLERETRDTGKWVTLYQRGVADEESIDEQISYWGRLPVREVTTGCGFSGGFSIGAQEAFSGGGKLDLGMSVPFSVMEFGVATDRYGKLTFSCPHCKFENKRPYNQLITNCQNVSCRRDVRC